MIALVVYFLLCWLVIKIGRPHWVAAGYVIFSAILDLVFSSPFTDVFIGAVIGFFYYWVVFRLINRYSDGIFLPLIIAAVGAAIPFFFIFGIQAFTAQ